MADEPLLAIDELLEPIPGEDPAGEPMAYAVRAELDEARKEINPDDFDANDPLRPTDVRKADWKGIIRKATEQLRTKSKDLLLAARLVEALTKQHGFAGLGVGLTLLRRLIDECWDRLHPTIEDGDLELRAGPFNWLGDDGRGARFPYTLRTVPLFTFGNEAVSMHDYRQAQEGKGKLKRDEADRAVNNASAQHCRQLVADVEAATAEMQKLLESLNARLGSEAPSLSDVRKVLVEALAFVRGAAQRTGGDAPPEPDEEAPAGEDATENGVATSAPARKMVTRADVYARLSEAADLLAQMEPHSPIPFLVRRAVALGQMPFPQLMRELMREDYHAGLRELDRELGIKAEKNDDE